MKVDVEGNVYCGGAGGLWIMDPHGKKLGRIVHGAPATTNLAFGGDDWKTGRPSFSPAAIIWAPST
jgi:gluconolactonase